tara:strand:+ start:123 stop:341 length:219 start_codon:yes stop_codon:yes gene_type:complete
VEEDLTLFDMTPAEKHGEIQDTNIEFLQIPLERGFKAKIINMLEDLCNDRSQTVYADLIYQIVKEKHEEINS